MKDPIILPTVLNKDEVQAIFDVTDNLKHKCILTTIYGSGLRLSEATTLKVSDIDSKNMRIFIEQAKGKKDRYVLLSQTNLDLLREYWKQFKPRHWLFEGMEKGSHITKRGVQDIFKKYLQKAHITKKATVHTLRHYVTAHFFTVYSNDILLIQKIYFPVSWTANVPNAPTNLAVFLSIPGFIVVSCILFILLIPSHYIIEHFADFNLECIGDTESKFQRR